MRGRTVIGLALLFPVAAGSAVGWAAHSASADAGAAPEPPACANGLLKGGYGIVGTGSGAGLDVGVMETMRFDGAGRMSGHGTAVFHRPAQPFRFEIHNATYSLQADCTGTMQWFAHFPGLGAADHGHTADIVVSDGGNQLMFIYTSTTFPGAPTGPYVHITAWGRRM